MWVLSTVRLLAAIEYSLNFKCALWLYCLVALDLNRTDHECRALHSITVLVNFDMPLVIVQCFTYLDRDAEINFVSQIKQSSETLHYLCVVIIYLGFYQLENC